MAARLEVTLFWYRPHCFYCANQVVLMLTSCHLHEKSREVSIKARSPPASSCIHGQVTKHTTVNWPIRCFGKKALASIAPYTFISHTKMPIFFWKGRSSSYILESQPGKLMLETFLWDNNTGSPSSLYEPHREHNMASNYKALYGIFYKLSMKVIKSENIQ